MQSTRAPCLMALAVTIFALVVGNAQAQAQRMRMREHWDSAFKDKHAQDGLVAMYTFEQASCFANAPHTNMADNDMFPSLRFNPVIAICEVDGEQPGMVMRSKADISSEPAYVPKYGAISTALIQPKVSVELHHELGFSFEFWFTNVNSDIFYETSLLGIVGSPFAIRMHRSLENGSNILEVTTPVGEIVTFLLTSKLIDGPHHMVLTFGPGSDKNIRAYINNMPPNSGNAADQIKSATVSFKFLLQGGHALTLLKRPSNDDQFFQTKLHLVSIYNRVLSPEDVGLNFEAKHPSVSENGVLPTLPRTTNAVVNGLTTLLSIKKIFPTLPAGASIVLSSLPDTKTGSLMLGETVLDSTYINKTKVLTSETQLEYKVNKTLLEISSGAIKGFTTASFEVAVFDSKRCGGREDFHADCIVPGSLVQLDSVIRDKTVSHIVGIPTVITLDAMPEGGCFAFEFEIGNRDMRICGSNSNADLIKNVPAIDGVSLCYTPTSSTPTGTAVNMYYDPTCGGSGVVQLLSVINVDVIQPIEACVGTTMCVIPLDACEEDMLCFEINAVDRRPESERLDNTYTGTLSYMAGSNVTFIQLQDSEVGDTTLDGLPLIFNVEIEHPDEAETFTYVGPHGEMVDLNNRAVDFILNTALSFQFEINAIDAQNVKTESSISKTVVLAVVTTPKVEIPSFYVKSGATSPEDEYQLLNWPGAGNSPFSSDIEWITDTLPEYDFTPYVFTIACAGFMVGAKSPLTTSDLLQVDPCFRNSHELCEEGSVIGGTKALLEFMRSDIYLLPRGKQSKPTECQLSLKSELDVVVASTQGKEIYISASDGSTLFLMSTAAGSISVAAGAVTLLMWYSTLWALSSRKTVNRETMLVARQRERGSGEGVSFTVDAP